MYFSLFVLSCLVTLFAIKYGDVYTNLILRVLRFGFLSMYFISLTKNHNVTYWIILASSMAASIFLIYNSSSVYAAVSICIARLALIHMISLGIRKEHISWKMFVFLVFLSIIIGAVVLSLYYNNSAFFYAVLIASFLLIIAFSLSFLRLLNTSKKGNLNIFIAICLFIVSDTIFGARRIIGVSASFLIIGSILYNTAYFLITQAMIKKDKGILVPNKNYHDAS